MIKWSRYNKNDIGKIETQKAVPHTSVAFTKLIGFPKEITLIAVISRNWLNMSLSTFTHAGSISNSRHKAFYCALYFLCFISGNI